MTDNSYVSIGCDIYRKAVKPIRLRMDYNDFKLLKMVAMHGIKHSEQIIEDEDRTEDIDILKLMLGELSEALETIEKAIVEK